MLTKEFNYCKKNIKISTLAIKELKEKDYTEFYALHKQATEGQCTGPRPSVLNLLVIKER
jgi:acyl-CoA-binding protein